MAGPFTALGGTVKVGGSDVADITKWSANPKAENRPYVSSSTNGYRRRLKGVRDISPITVEGLCNDTTKIETVFKIGNIIANLQLYQNGTLHYDGPAIVDDLKFDVDIETQEINKFVATLSADGAWTDFSPA